MRAITAEPVAADARARRVRRRLPPQNHHAFQGSRTSAIALGLSFAIAWLGLTPVALANNALAELGRSLFFDVNLSLERTQSCASCHQHTHALRDGRENRVGGASSIGSDGHSLGDRNTPSIAYANRVPELYREADGRYRGGLFHDGRARNLVDQAAEPFLNPLEMAMPDRASVVRRVREQPHYTSRFEDLFGSDIFDDGERVYRALTEAIATFERSTDFAPFDSRYDRYLRGEYRMSTQEELGRRLFFTDLTNCMNCHLLEANSEKTLEPFSDFRYHNIGLPINQALRSSNETARTFIDAGLAASPHVEHPAAERGKFRTPSLRNVAVTAPYMHNGVFAKLETAIAFYNQYIVVNPQAAVNPETGSDWGAPEIEENIATDLLSKGQPLDDQRIAALVAFLRTLTDRRYEHLLPENAEGDLEFPNETQQR